MNSIKVGNSVFKDVSINIKLKLSALWITIMFLFVYADLKAIYQSETVNAIIKGEILGMKIDNLFLLTSAILMSIPSIMIIASLLLYPRINRIMNIIFGIFFILVNIATYFTPGEVWYYYIYFSSLESIICFLIIRYAWKWPKIGE
jgi:hypothetical protein